jgi:hypothetical protein
VKTAFFSVDRFEGDVAVLVSDTGESVEMPRFELPKGLHEGSVLRVPYGLQNRPDWSRAALDRTEEERRRAEAKRTLDELKRSDPGGDIVL